MDLRLCTPDIQIIYLCGRGDDVLYPLANLHVAIAATRNMGDNRCRRQRTIGGREVIGELDQ